MNSLISVIIPVYKVEAYLTACVESVLAQTYQNFEIILVDDGSPDNCPRLCDEFAARDSRIRVIHKENGGLSSARNAGIEAAKGEYLAFLDSDDLWTPVFLERLYAALTNTGADFAVCLFQRFQGEPPKALPAAVEAEILSQREAFGCLFSLRNENMVIASNKLYKREIFDGIRYPQGILHEDEAVIHELIGAAKRVAWVEAVCYLYRETPNSITTSRFSLKRLDETIAKERRIAYFESHGLCDLAERTRMIYLHNLMRLYRTAQAELEDPAVAEEVCRNLHHRFCQIHTPQMMAGETTKSKLQCGLFRCMPRLYSKLEYGRLKRKGIL